MKAAIFSNHSPRVGFGVDRKMAVSRSQVMVVAASRNHLYRRRLQVVIDAGPRNQFEPKTPADSTSRRGLCFHALFCPSKIKRLGRRLKSRVTTPQPSCGDEGDDSGHRLIGSFLSEARCLDHRPTDSLQALRASRSWRSPVAAPEGRPSFVGLSAKGANGLRWNDPNRPL